MIARGRRPTVGWWSPSKLQQGGGGLSMMRTYRIYAAPWAGWRLPTDIVPEPDANQGEPAQLNGKRQRPGVPCHH